MGEVVVMGRFQSLFGRLEMLRAFHGWMTLGWGLLIPITVFTGLKVSIIWIALMSVWANFVGHSAAGRRLALRSSRTNGSRARSTPLPSPRLR